MTQTQVTIENAPRDLAEIKKLGRFNLRGLASELGVFASEESKQSYMGLNNDQQAETLMRLLTEHDKKKKGGGAAATSTGAAAPVTRTPSNKKGSRAPTNGTGAAAEQPAAIASGEGGSASSAAVAALIASVNELKANYATVSQQLADISGQLKLLQQISSGTNRFVTLSIGMGMQVAENVCQAPGSAILQAVVDDLPQVEQALLALSPDEGGDDEEEDEEEEDEGNE